MQRRSSVFGYGSGPTDPSEKYHKHPDVFQKWLEAKPGDEIVGTAGELYHCPLMKWANEVAPLPNNSKRGFNPHATGSGEPGEEWAVEFGKRTDATIGMGNNVTAAEALKILHEVMAEQASIG